VPLNPLTDQECLSLGKEIIFNLAFSVELICGSKLRKQVVEIVEIFLLIMNR